MIVTRTMHPPHARPRRAFARSVRARRRSWSLDRPMSFGALSRARRRRRASGGDDTNAILCLKALRDTRSLREVASQRGASASPAAAAALAREATLGVSNSPNSHQNCPRSRAASRMAALFAHPARLRCRRLRPRTGSWPSFKPPKGSPASTASSTVSSTLSCEPSA